MLWDSWFSVGRVLLVGVLAYPLLVLVLRVSGKRTLAKMNAFDSVVTVALGSTLATMLTDKSLSLFTGLAALAVLITLQFVVAWTCVRLRWFEHLVKSQPTELVREGRFRTDAMRQQRVSEAEIGAALRKHGFDDPRQASRVVLESDGSLSVIAASRTGATGRGGD